MYCNIKHTYYCKHNEKATIATLETFHFNLVRDIISIEIIHSYIILLSDFQSNVILGIKQKTF